MKLIKKFLTASQSQHELRPFGQVFLNDRGVLVGLVTA
jgi:hypothetical protein